MSDDTNTIPEWQHKVTLTKTIEYYGNRARLVVDAGLHYLKGNSAPHFSVTASVYEAYGNTNKFRKEPSTCGQLHALVREHFPELDSVTDLHLSDYKGVPMHYAANAMYHLGFGQYSALNLDHAASHIRITRERAVALRKAFSDGSLDPDTYFADQLPRFEREAQAAIATLKGLA